MAVASSQRFTRSHPCPICGGHDGNERGEGRRCFGYVSDNGASAYCTREEHAGGLSFHAAASGYRHRLKGDCPCGIRHDPTPPNGQAKTLDKVYPYRDEGGRTVFECVRYRPKSFKQRRPDGYGGYVWDLKGVRLVPYRLPELIQADPSRTVYVVEGEKDVERLAAIGLVATCNPMGAGKWRPEYALYFGGRYVVVLPDHDDAGRKHAEAVARSLCGIAATIKVLDLPGLTEKGDISDWLNNGGSAEDLDRLAAGATLWTPKGPNSGSTGSAATSLDDNGFPLTETGNAERLVSRHGRDLRFCSVWNKWLVWDGRRWRIDETGEVYRRAKETARSILHEAAEAADDERRRELVRFARQSESRKARDAMVALAASEPGIAITPSELDADGWLLTVENGTLDLRTGTLREHRRADLITKLAPVKYRPDAACPRWLGILERILPSESVRKFLQRAIGYTLTGQTSERVAFILYGSGANGKSTLFSILAALLGDYARRTPTETLLVKRESGIPNDVARLKGARFVYASEAEEGRRLAEALIKDLTGGDRVSARFMRGEWFEFDPEFKVWLGTNHKPLIRGTDRAIWDRIRLVPFSVTIPETERIPRHVLFPQLCEELPGILRWAIEGCLAWQREGMGAPDEVREATENYRAEMDVIASFLGDVCTLDPGMKTTAPDLYKAYTAWTEENGERPISQRAFGLRLSERGLSRAKSNRKNWWLGVGITENETAPMEHLSTHSTRESTSTIAPEKLMRVMRNPGAVGAKVLSDAGDRDQEAIEWTR